MLAEGAAGDTKAELVSALKNASYSGDILESGDGCIISSANSVWIRSGFPVLPGYASLLKNSYSAEIAERDFSVLKLPSRKSTNGALTRPPERFLKSSTTSATI